MKKEKTIRTYQRRTKTGKVVTVKQHTAKYDAAEALKEAAKKKGAGDELEALKKKPKYMQDITDEELAKEAGVALDRIKQLSEEERKKLEMGVRQKRADKEAKEYRKSPERKKAIKGANEMAKSKPSKDATDPYSAHGFTKDEFKEWYEGTGSKADKKVEKALKKAMGTKAYNALSDKAADEYKKGGAHRFFTKGLEEMKASTSADTKSVTSGKETKDKKSSKSSKEDKSKKTPVTGTSWQKLMYSHKNGDLDVIDKLVEKLSTQKAVRKLPKNMAYYYQYSVGGEGASETIARKVLSAMPKKYYQEFLDDFNESGGSNIRRKR